jgi:hypothetical protein
MSGPRHSKSAKRPPILAVEATLAALTSFTLIGPLGLPWWLPVIVVAVVGTASAGLRHLALSKGRELWRGLAVLRSRRGGARVIAFVLMAVFAQILRNWMLLHAVGVPASFFDAIAVLIAVVALGQLPVGPGVGAGGRRPYPGPPRRGRCRRGGGADDGHRDRRRLVLRGVVRRRPAVGTRPPDPLAAADRPRVELSRRRRTHHASDRGASHATVGNLLDARANATRMMGTGISRPLLRSDFAQRTARSTPNGELTDSSSPATEGLPRLQRGRPHVHPIPACAARFAFPG